VREVLTAVDRSKRLAAYPESYPRFAHNFPQVGGAMALKVKDINKSAAKFVARAGVAGADYTAGIQAAGTSQFDNAVAAAPSWAAGVQAAAANGAFVKGLNKAGPQKWTTNAMNKGSKNYPGGVAAAQGAYAAAVGPYFQVLQNLDPGPRFPRGDPRNQARSVAVQVALRKQKTGG
jgi:hypothetical protein